MARFAPRRGLPAGIDALAMLRDSEAGRAEERRVTEEAIKAARALSTPQPDPWPAEVNARLAALEEAVQAFRDIFARGLDQ